MVILRFQRHTDLLIMITNNKKSKEELLASLSANMSGVIESESCELSTKSECTRTDIIIKDTEDDYEFARSHIKKLILTSNDAIDRLYELASDAEHPRAYEVLSAMIKNTADINSSLLDLIKNRKKIVLEPVGGSSASGNVTNNNAIFVGSTTDLQKFLKTREESSIDV